MGQMLDVICRSRRRYFAIAALAFDLPSLYSAGQIVSYLRTVCGFIMPSEQLQNACEIAFQYCGKAFWQQSKRN